MPYDIERVFTVNIVTAPVLYIGVPSYTLFGMASTLHCSDSTFLRAHCIAAGVDVSSANQSIVTHWYGALLLHNQGRTVARGSRGLVLLFHPVKIFGGHLDIEKLTTYIGPQNGVLYGVPNNKES
jgi:hypothetical protein